MNYGRPETLGFMTLAGNWIVPGKAEVDRIQKENAEAIRDLNPAFSYVHNYTLARDAWLPRIGKKALSDDREMEWRRTRISRILRCGGGVE